MHAYDTNMKVAQLHFGMVYSQTEFQMFVYQINSTIFVLETGLYISFNKTDFQMSPQILAQY